MIAEVALLGNIPSARRLKLVSEAIDDTIASLPDTAKELLAGEACAPAEAAIRSIHAAVSGSSVEESDSELGTWSLPPSRRTTGAWVRSSAKRN